MTNELKSGGQLWEAVAAIVIGLLFVIWPDSVIEWVVLFMGIISLVIGVIQIVTYFMQRSRPAELRGNFPLLGLLTLIWGVLLLLRPEVWVNLFMVVMSIPMVLMAIGQIALLMRKKRAGFTIPWAYYIFPVLLFLAGLTVMFNPFASAMWLVFFVGVWVIAYGVIEMISSFSLRKQR